MTRRASTAQTPHGARPGIACCRPPWRPPGALRADEARRFGLPCGGTLALLLEFNPDLAALDALVVQLEAGQLVRRSVDCASGAVTLHSIHAPAPLHFDGATLACTLGPQYRMLLIGAGALAEYVATMALFNDFAVTVCDPRSEYLVRGGRADQHRNAR